MAFTFVHAADLHLDSPFRAVRADERLRAVLQESTFGALRALVDLCLRQRAAFLVLAGDLFDARDRSVRARLALRRELARLDEAGIRTFIVHGNHDPLSGAGGMEWPASVKVFGPDWEEVVVTVDADGGRCRVQGISYPQERVTENLARRFSRQGPEFTVAVLHANVGGHAGHANYAPCSLGELDERGLDYWALGHVHTRAEYPLPGGGLAAYPGNLQGRHAFEAGPRGCLVVTVDGGRIRERRFEALDRVRWHQLRVDVSGLGDPGELFDAVDAAVEAAVQEGSFAAHAVRVILEGEAASGLELTKIEAVDQLQRELSEALAARPVPVLLERLEDCTRPPLELARIRQEGALGAELLAVVDQAKNHPSALATLWAQSELDTLDTRLRKAGVAATADQATALLERAAARALMLLGQGG